MILTDSDIETAVTSSEIKIEPFSLALVQPASYDLRVGESAIATSSNSVEDIESKGYFELRPGDFGIILTRETLQFDASHTARIGLRSKYARKGVIATTGPQVDPGFHGRLKIGVTNLSPHVISFPYEDHFITLEIHKLSKPSMTPYSGPYQGDVKPAPEDIEAVTEGDNMGFAKMLDSLTALSRNVGQLTESVNKFAIQNEATQQQLRENDRQNKFTHWILATGLTIIFGIVAFIAIMVAIK